MLEQMTQFDQIVQIVAILVGAYIIQLLAKKAIAGGVRKSVSSRKLTAREEKLRENTLISVLSTATTVVIWILAGLTILSNIGIDIAPILAGAGIAGVALGFGAQTMVKDFLAGLFILSENQYRVGDVLQVNEGVAGVVEKISLRATVLRDLEGKVHHIANGNIQIATNMTLGYANVDVNVGIGYEADIDRVEKIINKVGEEIFKDEKWEGIVLEPAKMLRVDSFDDSSIALKIVCKTAPMEQWNVKSEILRRVKKAFDKEGIEIPFPQRVVHTK